MKHKLVPRTAHGKALLNLACGTRFHGDWNNVDFSPYARLSRRPIATFVLRAARVISSERSDTITKMRESITAWDLRHGIPYPDDCFDVVYHSHFLEHLPRDAAEGFLLECKRVLKPGGVIRVVVPDLDYLVERYRGSFTDEDLHQDSIAAIFEQMVRTEAACLHGKTGLARVAYKWLRSDPAQTGELHRWMYDRVTLAALLRRCGYANAIVRTASESHLPGWTRWGLDTEQDGTPYKPESLYMEANKPPAAGVA
jgi:SAM-dependent methyltransferase